MSEESQRKLGLKLAIDAKATKTAALIKDPSTTYADILKAAVAEVGAAKVAQAVAKADDPALSFNTLLHVNGIGSEDKALIEQAQQRHAERVQPDGPQALAVGGPVSGFKLNLVAGVGFTCQFTMYWISAPGVTQPNAGTPNQGSWKFSITLDAVSNNTWGLPCGNFALRDSPLAIGDTVWMVVDINCAKRHELPERFIYGEGSYANYNTWGVPTSPKFELVSS